MGPDPFNARREWSVGFSHSDDGLRVIESQVRFAVQTGR
jgi:hypothetical protein